MHVLGMPVPFYLTEWLEVLIHLLNCRQYRQMSPLLLLYLINQYVLIVPALLYLSLQPSNIELVSYLLLNLPNWVNLLIFASYQFLQLTILLTQIFQGLLLKSEIVLFLVFYNEDVSKLGLLLLLFLFLLLGAWALGLRCDGGWP